MFLTTIMSGEINKVDVMAGDEGPKVWVRSDHDASLALELDEVDWLIGALQGAAASIRAGKTDFVVIRGYDEQRLARVRRVQEYAELRCRQLIAKAKAEADATTVIEAETP